MIGASTANAEGAKIVVFGGQTDDPFRGVGKKVPEDAGLAVMTQDSSVTLPDPQDQDNLVVESAEPVHQGIDQGGTGSVALNPVPEAMGPAFIAVKEVGISFIILNAGGLQAADRLGAMNRITAVQGIARAVRQGKVQVCGVNFDEAILNGWISHGVSIPTREILTGPVRQCGKP